MTPISISRSFIFESLGKNGKGFLPVISNAPKDHHSLLQLYLDGPKDKIFHIFSHEEESFEKVSMNKTIGKINFLDKKKIEWSFQETSHDLWDYDVSSPPILATLNFNDKKSNQTKHSRENCMKKYAAVDLHRGLI